MDPLPFIDEHSVAVAAPPDATWAALLRVVRGSFGGAELVARALGCVPSRATPAFTGAVGDALPGFRVVAAEPGAELVLRGRHRFSRYELRFLVEPGRLRARTSAIFPGLRGRIYRVLVIGTRGHVLVTRRLLSRVARRSADRPTI